MKILVSRPNFPAELKRRAEIAAGKELTCDIVAKEDRFQVIVNAKNYNAGILTFKKNSQQKTNGPADEYQEQEKTDTECTLVKFQITDAGSYPVEFALEQLTKFLKRRKIKYIVINSDKILKRIGYE